MVESLKKAMTASIGVEKMKQPISWGDVCGLFDELVEMQRDLLTRVRALESHGIKYLGAYQRASTYQRGSVVTHHGSSWIALQPVAEGSQPGSSEDWQLMVKKGRDGRDAGQ